MILTIHHKARARISASGRAVYPLEIFGLLLGTLGATEDDAYAVAALPVGKTRRWGAPDGRFDDSESAAATAGEAFRPWGLRPIGLFSSDADYLGECRGRYCDAVPHINGLPWVVVTPLFGGEKLFRSVAYHDSKGRWEPAEFKLDRHTAFDPLRNTKRILTAWNHTWGALDYDNGYRDELARREREQTDP